MNPSQKFPGLHLPHPDQQPEANPTQSYMCPPPLTSFALQFCVEGRAQKGG